VYSIPDTTFVHIMDDDESVRKGLSRLLRSSGIECRAYDCPESLLKEIRNEENACIIMDITMPKMSGIALGKALKDKRIVTPIIAVSARDDDETRQLVRDLGVQFFLRKPVDNQALIDAISWVVQHTAVAH